MILDWDEVWEETDDPYWCDICDLDCHPKNGSHWHCGNCRSTQLTGMFGHLVDGKFTCDPDEPTDEMDITKEQDVI